MQEVFNRDDFFDRLKGGASKAKDNAEKIAKMVAQRTSNAINQTKLTYAANELQSKIKDMYAEIGKSIYEKYLDGTDADEDLADYIEQIDKLMEELQILNDKISELKNTLKCPECGAFNSIDSDYCSKCGAQIRKADEDDEFDIDAAYDIGESAESEEDIEGVEAEYTDDGEEVITINSKKPE